MTILGLESDEGREKLAAKLMRINRIIVQNIRRREFEQDTPSSYNVTLRRISSTTAGVEKQCVFHFMGVYL